MFFAVFIFAKNKTANKYLSNKIERKMPLIVFFAVKASKQEILG